ncbi:unnamed protein product [Rotaria magnacalcarata]|uniref:mRNA export factor GLE1 n=2 Tax=Rotaria magnacalcarata TaxID=392030 RepID=A0A816GWC5_9BILA|nr:unnamed protein product [Rotaria magnacalcarata]
MDEIHENKLQHHKRIEDIIKNFEQSQAKENERMQAVHLESKSHSKSIGPANDLLRFMYILEQQYQTDDDETRMKARENVIEYIDRYRPTDDDETRMKARENVIEYIDQYPSTDDDEQPNPVNDLSQQQSIFISNPQPPIPLPSPLKVVTSVPQSIMPSPPTVVAPLVKSPSTNPSQSPPSISTNDLGDIKPGTLLAYKKLSSEAQQYEIRYLIVDLPRKKQLASYIKNVMNKLRKETFELLTNELFQFLCGQEKTVSNQGIRIKNEEERLLCLSIVATLILAQLLGGDLNDIKTEIFLPLISMISKDPQHKEFGTIFLGRLHKKCPYTVPYYPIRQSHMNDKQYLEAIGYIEKQDGDQRRLETETEFLVRMNGLIRLFCKLLITRGPPFDNKLEFAWRWFADVLNLTPRPNITSILIRVFLEEAGEIMVKSYGNQFIKILEVIREKYIPRIENETSIDQMTRLRLKLDKLPK